MALAVMEQRMQSKTTWCELKFLLGGLRCYKDILMKESLAYDISKITAKLKSDNVQYRNKI